MRTDEKSRGGWLQGSSNPAGDKLSGLFQGRHNPAGGKRRRPWDDSRPAGKVIRRKTVKVAASCYSGSNERCGDSCGWAALPDGKWLTVVSDGTGKGEAAARDSASAVNGALGLLKAGMDSDMALQILNLLWTVSNRKERFPTMDLALLDPDTRELFVYKIGAAPTLIMRKTGKFEILTAPAMPMGVTEYAHIPRVSTMVSAGDRIIMMTDGVSDSVRNDTDLNWMQRCLTRIKSRNLQTVCDLLLREAALNYGNNEKDDLTIVIFQL